MAASDPSAPAFVAAREAAPRAPGVYFFLGDGAALLYVGKAGDIRGRLRQHERAHATSTRVRLLYEQVREIRWELSADAVSAADREADLIVTLRPPYNASHTGDGRWAYVLVRARPAGEVQLSLAHDPDVAGARAYGCFAHLGVGVSSPRAIACSEGYAAFARLLWAASTAAGRHFPRGIAGPSPPADFTARLDEQFRSGLHDFFSGRNERLVTRLLDAAAGREEFMQPALRRDAQGAAAFFAHGPSALRALGYRHGQPDGALTRETIERLVAAEVGAAIGDFTLLELRDPTEGLLGARASKSASVAAARRSHRAAGDRDG